MPKEVILKDRNLELIRETSEGEIEIKTLVHGEGGGWSSNVININLQTRRVEYYWIHWNYNGTGRETIAEKIVSQSKLEKIVKKALRITTLSDFDELKELVKKA